MPKGELHIVRRAFPFYGEIPADSGAVFAVRGYVNDEKLLRLGFLEVFTGKHDALVMCGTCGTKFSSGQYRDAHGDRRHRPEPVIIHHAGSFAESLPSYSHTGIEGTMVADVDGDSLERLAEQDAPIYWEKTKASQRG